MTVKKDLVNSPAHYVGKVEVIDYLEDKQSIDGHIGFLEGNVIKYISRWRKKNGLEDLEKAQWYLNRLVEFAKTNTKIIDTKELMKKLP